MQDKFASKQDILKAFRFRHATKRFDPNKKIPKEDFDFILEAGRLSPSSFGFEPWKFLIVQNSQLREKIRNVSWGAQGQLPTASHFVIVLAKTNLRYDSEYLQDQLKNVHKMPDEVIEGFVARTQSFQDSDLPMLKSERALLDWSARQTYIALGNMMTAAALIGIDSCPIEGFDHPAVNEILEQQGFLEAGKWRAVVMAAFGYRAEEPNRPKSRKDINQVVQWVTN